MYEYGENIWGRVEPWLDYRFIELDKDFSVWNSAQVQFMFMIGK